MWCLFLYLGVAWIPVLCLWWPHKRAEQKQLNNWETELPTGQEKKQLFGVEREKKITVWCAEILRWWFSQQKDQYYCLLAYAHEAAVKGTGIVTNGNLANLLILFSARNPKCSWVDPKSSKFYYCLWLLCTLKITTIEHVAWHESAIMISKKPITFFRQWQMYQRLIYLLHKTSKGYKDQTAIAVL